MEFLNQNKMEQTAMQMAINHYKKLSEQGSNHAYFVAKFLEENFLEVEKQQIISTYIDGNHSEMRGGTVIKQMSEQYYNETFKSE